MSSTIKNKILKSKVSYYLIEINNKYDLIFITFDGKININFIGKFENLEQDFQQVLQNIGFTNIIHEVEKEMNKRPHKPYYEYYDQETLDKVNHLLQEDFDKLDYKKCDLITELNN